ncbi:xanthine dehydrogenase family protein molybdopterin-binding subunit [Emcibacter sp. SYSU 3D8]|uniref:xanthine dehydrogenase family protein molybdopterin-binding subunit n=1 Tax=Emcibacter sp. SYSU 3D8 TaxID=3133969 RepID=UPI0031FEC851
MPIHEHDLDRRTFLKATAALGLVIGVSLPGAGRAIAAGLAKSFEPNAFVRVAPDNTVTVIIKHHEMGQGVTTGLATLVADEMDADWSQIRTEYAPANDALYKNLIFGFQATGGSTSIANSFDQMRMAGATARAMLVAAAAKDWGVAAASIVVSKGELSVGAYRATFGQMAAAAAALTPPENVTLKTPADYVYIGKSVPRLDVPAKSTGTETYTSDLQLPGLLTAVTAHPPKFGATVKSVDASAALAIKGVVKVVEIPEGVAVVAKGMWPAIQGRDALKIIWDEAKAETRSSADLVAAYKALLDTPGAVALNNGDVTAGLASGQTIIEAVYEFPYLAHAAMEPMNCVAWLHDGKLETWSGHQAPSLDRGNAAAAAGLGPDQVTVHTLPSGGSFGRRSTFNGDHIAEAVHIARAMGGEVPIRLQRTREDDMRAGHYRPLYVHGLTAAIDDAGTITAWSHRIVGQSIYGSFPPFAALIKDGVDSSSVEGAATIPYAIPNARVDLHSPAVGVPVHVWRSVGNSHTAYAVETMIDELAAAAGKDPVAFRLALLTEKPRHAGVLRLAAEKAGWGTSLPQGVARGVAVHESFNTYVAQVVELRIADDGSVKVDRVVVAVDCGQVVNPDIIRAQMEGAVGFGLSATLYSELTLDRGAVTQGNFDGFEVLRLDRMPVVEVHIVDSTEQPTGVGEPGVPPIGPAVANAVAVLTGSRIRTLPMAGNVLKTA